MAHKCSKRLPRDLEALRARLAVVEAEIARLLAAGNK
jgi:hypothetical protein